MRLESFEAIVRALNQAAVPFLVVGGVAVNAHGYGRLTNYVDIVIRLRPATIASAFQSLASVGYVPRVPITAEQFSDATQRAFWIAERQMQVLNFSSNRHRETQIDMFVQEPFDFDTEYANAVVHRLADDVPVRIVRLDALIKLKREAGRPQDLTDVAELLAIRGERADD
jgi:hypothetical protein